MSVHHDISKHSNDQHARVEKFKELELKREELIESALNKCRENQSYAEILENINGITEEMNDLARKGIVPQRKKVTKQMVEEYCRK